MRIDYDKLVRDNIPQMIKEEGGDVEVTTYAHADFSKALLAKLVEEATEAADATTEDELISELADIFEVIDAIMADRSISPEAVLYRKVARRKERGSFTQRVRLVWSTPEE